MDGATVIFDFYHDYRLASIINIRADSWIGPETSGTTFGREVRVRPGATLTVAGGTQLTFASGQDDARLIVEEGAKVVIEPGASIAFTTDAALANFGELVVQGNTTEQGAITFAGVASLTNYGDLVVETNGRFEASGSVNLASMGRLAVEAGSVFALLAGTYVVVGGEVEFGRSIWINPGVGFHIQPGTTVRLGQHVRLIVRQPVTWTGTPSNPITFTRRNPNAAWGAIDLEVNGNTFERVIVEGGSDNVLVRSAGNVFKHSTFRNGTQGLRSTTTLTGTKTSFDLFDSLVENNASHGLSISNTNPRIGYSTIRGNGVRGILLTLNSGTSHFAQNVIENNGLGRSDGDALIVATNSWLWSDAHFMRNGRYGGYNRITGFGRYAVFATTLSTGTTIGYGDGYDDHNTIHGPAWGTHSYFYNDSPHTAFAIQNYWGGQPNSQSFCQPYVAYDPQAPCSPVDYRWWGSADETSGSGGIGAGQAGQLLAMSALGTEGYASASDADTTSTSATASTSSSTTASPAPSADDRDREAWDRDREAIRVRLAELRQILDPASSASVSSADASSGEAGRLLRETAMLLRVRFRDDGGEREAARVLIGAWAEKLMDTAALRDPVLREAAEVAATLRVQDAMDRDALAEAAQHIERYGPRLVGTSHRTQVELHRAMLYARAGDVDAALAVVRQTRELAEQSDDLDRMRKDLDIMEAEMVFLAERAVLRDSDELSRHMADANAYSEAHSDPAAEERHGEERHVLAFALEAPYPNPTRVGVAIPFELAQSADVSVSVYDVLGRRSALVVHGERPAGRHEAHLDASTLAAGVYLVRLVATTGDGSSHVFTQRLTVTR
jgi:hypothetical protein